MRPDLTSSPNFLGLPLGVNVTLVKLNIVIFELVKTDKVDDVKQESHLMLKALMVK